MGKNKCWKKTKCQAPLTIGKKKMLKKKLSPDMILVHGQTSKEEDVLTLFKSMKSWMIVKRKLRV